MLKSILFLALVCATVATVADMDMDSSCAKDSYAGYPCCKNKMNAKSSCDQAQKDLSADGKWCPDPKFDPPNDLSADAMKPWPAGSSFGHINFLVYRAATSSDTYATVLSNSNAADRAGVLSYLHTEVVPQDMRFREDIESSQRKFGIDSIMVFNVTVFNPKPYLTPQIPLSGYVAFDAGKCLASDKGCQKYATDGYQVGFQVQENNVRAQYSNDTLSNYWYSFPGGGLCDKPNGTKTCTYNYEVVGRISIDELVNLDRLGFKDYKSFAKYNSSTASSANIEFTRMGRVRPECCETDLENSIPFWNAPCDLKQSYARIQALMSATIRPVNDTNFYNNTRNCGQADDAKGLSTGEVIAIIAGGVVFVSIAVFVIRYFMRYQNKAEKQPLMNQQTTSA